MANIRFPVLLWKDGDGHHCACAIHEPAPSTAIARTRSDALDQVKEYFAYVHQQEPWREMPDFEEPTLTHFAVPLRAASPAPRGERRSSRRALFASAPISLPILCVHGKTSGGLLFAAAPLIDVFFTYAPTESLKETFIHYVQQALAEHSLEALSRLLAPADVQLDELIVKLDRPRSFKPESRTEALGAVADPISSRDFKADLARPWQRDELLSAFTAFLVKEKTSALLVGEPGVGKSALLVEAARRAQREFVPAELAISAETNAEETPALNLPRFWLTSGSRIIAGMKYLGQWQERVEDMIEELTELRGVLCVDRLLDLVSSGGRDPSASIGAFLVPYLRRGELRLIAEATPAELDACRRLLPGLVDACRQFRVEPLTAPQTVAALEQVGKVLTQGHRVTLEPAALSHVHSLFTRFQPYHPMPGPAVQFLKELVDHAAAKRTGRITTEFILAEFTRRTGLPEWLLRDELPLHSAEIRAQFESQIIGQPEPCRAAADVILSFKAGVNDPRRPLGVLLFAGPTGVGKTELARAMASYLFGQGEKRDRLVRLDMSEFSGDGTMAAERLIGPPDGEPGPLIRAVRRQPFNVILLDEIEKASPEVFDLLLGLFDEGRLTDRYGRLTTFRSTIIIMTSNLGASSAEPFGLSPVPGRSYESEIAGHFRPEFFNRIDAVVTFNPLNRDAMRQIAARELGILATREGFALRRFRLEWTDALVDHLVAVGFDKRYGARPLQRTMEELVTTPLARKLAAKRPHATTTRTITLDLGADKTVTFRGL